MAWTLVKNEPGAGAAAALSGDWTEQAGVANWAKNGSGAIVPGESYQTAVRLTAQLASADMAVAAQITAANAAAMDHFLIVRSHSAINDDDLFDSIRIAGSEVYYNGAYQDDLSYGNLPSFVTNPVIRVEAQGSTYTFFFNGTEVGTLTARLDGSGGRYAGFKSVAARTWLDLNVYVWEEEGGTEHTAAAALSGTGTVGAAAAKSTFGASTLSGTGTVAATGTRTQFTSAALGGSGTLTSTANVLHLAAAAFVGTGTLSASFGATEHLAAAALSGTGTVGAAANVLHLAAAGIGGTGSVSSAAIRTAFGTVGISGTGSLSAVATATLLASAGLTGTGTLTAAASLDGPGLIQFTAGRLTSRWDATPLTSTWVASDLDSPWAATPLQGDA